MTSPNFSVHVQTKKFFSCHPSANICPFSIVKIINFPVRKCGSFELTEHDKIIILGTVCVPIFLTSSK